MKTGKVKFFIESKGFGFITEDETNEDFFVHVTGLNGVQIQQHDHVEFDTQEGKKGINAVNVKRI
ncbi:cold-shock protein [Pontibacter silvestris]|uniref:Cold-shock protein n=1 Tax=Pontibacter silvestris TaxID=2305183 RepID=A0ABW4X2U4_9BACT|nr:cold shock domain-containing protein [Pontibacter silvestris]MCC9137111.1 cold shock domain-containing protein [Pontibacter silvestris]